MLRRIAMISGSGIVAALALALVQLRVGALFGAGSQLDAFLVGTATPALLLSLSASIVTALVTPRLSRLQGAAAAIRAGQFASVGILLGAAGGVVVIALAPQIVGIVAPGLNGQSSRVAENVLRLYAIGFGPTIAAHVYGAYGYANGRVWTAGLSGTLYGFLWLGLEFTPAFTSTARDVAVAGLLATVVQVSVAFRASTRLGDRLPWPGRPVLHRPAFAFLAVSGMLLAAMYWRVNLFLDPLFGSLLAKGSVAELTYAYRIVLLVIMICGQGSALTILAISGVRGKVADRETSIGLLVTTTLAVGLAGAMAFGSEQMAALVLGRGRFSYGDARDVGKIIALYSPAMVLITVCWALESLLMSAGRVKTVVRTGVTPFIVNVGITILAINAVGQDARPLAVGCSAFLYCCLLLWRLRHDSRVNALFSIRVATQLGATFVASSGVVLLTQNALSPSIGARTAALIGCLTGTGLTVLAIVGSLRTAPLERILPKDTKTMDGDRGESLRGHDLSRRDRVSKGFNIAGSALQTYVMGGTLALIAVGVGAGIALGAVAAVAATMVVLLAVLLACVVRYGPVVFGWILIGVVPLVPVVEGNGVFTIGSVDPSVLRIGMVVLAVVAGLSSLQGRSVRKTRGDKNVRLLNRGFLVFAAVGLLVSIGGATDMSSFLTMLSNATGQPAIYALVLLFFVTAMRVIPATRVQFLRALALAIILETGVVVYQYRTGLAFDMVRGYSRAQGTMGSDFLGAFALVAFFGCAALRIEAKGRKARIFANVGAGCAITSLVVSLSRGPIIGFILGVLVFAASRQQSPGGRRRSVVTGAAIVLVMAGGLYASRTLWAQRLTAQSTGAFDRPATWISGLRIGEDHPFLGVGPGNVAAEIGNNLRYSQTQYGTVGVNPHNAWIYAFAEGGLFYALALVWLTILLIYVLRRHPHREGHASQLLTSGLAGVFPIFFINNLFTHPEVFIPTLLLYAVVLAGRGGTIGGSTAPAGVGSGKMIPGRWQTAPNYLAGAAR
jgi:putative peptidoglycan lipid II flippase